MWLVARKVGLKVVLVAGAVPVMGGAGTPQVVRRNSEGKTGCGARRGFRRVPNGGVGILGGVPDRLGLVVKVEAEACGLEARRRLGLVALFDGVQLFQLFVFLGG